MALNVTGGALEFDAIVNASQFGAQIREMELRLKGLTSTANEQASSVENFAKKAALAIGTYTSVTAVSNFITDVARVRGQFQQLEVAFETMLGSKEKAQKLLAEVTEFAAKTPFELSEVAGATKQLLAFGIGAEKISSTLRSLGDIAAGLGQPLSEIAYLYGTIKTAGVANSVDIKQFAQRGIPIYEALSEVLKVNVKEVNNLVSAGKVGFPEIEKAFKALTSEGSKFGGLMAAQAKTLGGLTSNFRDAYDQMLNDIGKSSEGLFASSIKGATFVVENYQKVLDIIKVLAITYGTYKAAVIATNVVNGIAIGLTKGYTIAETLRYRAMLISEGAMKLLNRTMLANPFVAVAAGVAAIVSAFVIFRRETTQVKTAQELLAKAQEQFGDKLAETQAKIRPYVDALKNANLSEQERVDIYNKLKAIDPEIVKGLNAKTISYEKLTGNVNNYLDALRKQYALEANKEALQASIREENRLQEQIKKTEKDLENLNAAREKARTSGLDAEATRGVSFVVGDQQQNLELLKNNLEAQKKVSAELGQVQVDSQKKTDDAVKRTIKIIEDEIKALREKQSANSATSKEYQDFQKQIEAKEKELEAIRGKSKSTIASENKLENEINSLLNTRKDLLQSIDELRRGAKQSGLSKEQSELDKINEKYDEAILKITEYNKKVADFNKKHHTSVRGVGLLDINALNSARTEELRNAQLKEDAQAFAKNLEEQKALFEKYEEAKKNIGVEKANEMFAEQTKNFKSYSDFLQSEFNKVGAKFLAGIANSGDRQKFKDLVKAISDETKKQTEQQIKDFADLLGQTSNFNDKRQAIDVKYQKLFETLKNNRVRMSEEEYDRRLQALQTSQDDEINALKISFAKQAALYKKLGEDLILQTRAQLKQRLAELQKISVQGFTIDPNTGIKTFLTPQMKADLDSGVAATKSLLDNTNKTAIAAGKFGKKAAEARDILQGLADVAGVFGGQLADVLNNMLSIVDAAGDIATSIGKFATGDIAGGIGSAISGVSKLIKLAFGESPEEKAFKERLRKLESDSFTGEFAINELYRERLRDQVRINELRIEGIKKETALLQAQKAAIDKDFQEVLKKLQSLRFTATQAQVDAFLAQNPNISGVQKELAKTFHLLPLLGKSFEDLEKLNTFGQLDGDAKQLFETLQKLKNEGVDVDKALANAKKEFQEIFTGTTADSLRDSIAEMFKQGKTSAADFADFFKNAMRDAALSIFEFKFLEPKMAEFFEQFSAAAESGGALDATEIGSLQAQFNKYMKEAQKQFENLQQITGINLAGQGASSQNVLVGNFRQMSEDTGNELVGQFNGQRMATLQLLDVQKSAEGHLNLIANNTANTVIEIRALHAKMEYYYRDKGVKI